MPTIRLPKRHAAQEKVAAEMRRYGCLCCGRRWGKTLFGLDLAIREALKGKPVGWIGPNYKTTAGAFRDCENILAGAAEINRNERYVRLGSGSIEFWSADTPSPARSRKFSLLIVDECAWIPNLAALWTGALRPTLSDLRGRCLFLSTPNGLGYFHELFQRGLDEERSEWRSWQMPTSTNPYIAAAEIEAARADMPELSFRQEYLAEFVNFEGAVFRHLERALFDVPDELKAPQKVQPWHTFQRSFVIGVDWGGITDRTAIAVATDEPFAPLDGSGLPATGKYLACAPQSPPVTICELDYFRDRDFSVQRARLRAIWERYGRPPIIGEENSMGRAVQENLRDEGIPVRGFVTTNASKALITQGVALDLERGNIRLPRDPILLGEMQSFEATRLESGMTKYSAPPGQHDDLVMAVLLARHGLVRYGGWQNNPYWAERKKNAILMVLGG